MIQNSKAVKEARSGSMRHFKTANVPRDECRESDENSETKSGNCSGSLEVWAIYIPGLVSIVYADLN